MSSLVPLHINAAFIREPHDNKPVKAYIGGILAKNEYQKLEQVMYHIIDQYTKKIDYLCEEVADLKDKLVNKPLQKVFAQDVCEFLLAHPQLLEPFKFEQDKVRRQDGQDLEKGDDQHTLFQLQRKLCQHPKFAKTNLSYAILLKGLKQAFLSRIVDELNNGPDIESIAVQYLAQNSQRQRVKLSYIRNFLKSRGWDMKPKEIDEVLLNRGWTRETIGNTRQVVYCPPTFEADFC